LLLILALVALAVVWARGWRRPRPPKVVPRSLPPTTSSTFVAPVPQPLTLQDVVWAYECAVLEVTDATDATKARALTLLAEKIVPLIGGLAFDDLAQVHAGVRYILDSELDAGGDRAVLVVWDDFVRWSSFHFRKVGERRL